MDKNKNKNTRIVTDLIKEVTKKPAGLIAVPTQLIHFVGNVPKAVFLSQLLYWSDKGSRSDGYIFKTAKEWEIETGLSEYQVGTATEKLVELDVLQTKVKKANGSPTTHYKLDIEKLCVLLRQFLEKGNEESSGIKKELTGVSLTDTTSKNTQDTSSRESELSTDNESSLLNKKTIQSSKEEETFVVVNDRNSDIGTLTNVQTIKDGSTRIKLPENFNPSLDENFLAVSTFPKKSPKYVTQKFIEHYSQRGSKKTLAEWHNEWWNWMNTERPSVDNYYLDEEHIEIKNAVSDVLSDAYYELEDYVVQIEHLRHKVGNRLSDDSFRIMLESLVYRQWFTKAAGFVYVTEHLDDKETRFTVMEELYKVGFDAKDLPFMEELILRWKEQDD